MKIDIINREQWLNAAVEKFKPVFSSAGLEIPPLYVSCGFPSRNATSNKKRRIGECWDGLTSADKKPQLFITPFLIDPIAPGGVLATLAHELVHATIGCKAGHGPAFVKAMKKVGLEGKPTATSANEELLATCGSIVKSIGAYPHSELKLVKERKVQTTRMLKAACPECEYQIRLTRKWAAVGVPNCPCAGHGLLKLDNHLEEAPEGD